ncbi:hypothetical protein KUV65_15800 [Maritalea mobilis]|uniref:hypothetical protein n=1 Tax=Maritalea mobilis TaxID=483324 RepID=UPI001C97C127|nr:hypothetical protein [Maritalea mobilis]MBY6202838.1 hypothetical protein [Maritalea mobilis]
MKGEDHEKNGRENGSEKSRERFNPAPSRAVRPVPKSSKGHFVGALVFEGENGPQTLHFASLTEHNASLCLIYRPDFHDIEEQLAALHFTLPNGKPSRHFFDFRVTQKGGRRVCISVKPERIAVTYEYRAMMAEVKRAAIGNICDAVATITERNIDPVELHNAKLFHDARHREPEIDEIVLKSLAEVRDPTTINEFLLKAGLGGRGFFSVARAIRFGQATLFTPEPIRGKTLIVRGEAV